MEKTLLKLTTKLLNKTEEEVKALIQNDEGAYREDAADILITAQEENVKSLKTNQFDAGYKKAEGKYKTDREAIENEVAAKFTEEIDTLKRQKGAKEVTDDVVKNHPLYLDLEQNTVKKELYETTLTEFETFKQTNERNKVIGGIKNKVWGLTSERKPLLEEVQAVADNRKNVYLSEFEKYDYQEVGDSIFVMQDGKRLENNLGHPVTLKDLEETISKNHFVFKKQEPKGGSGTAPVGYAKPQESKIAHLSEPSTIEEYNKTRAGFSLHKKEDREMLKAYTEAYNDKFAN